MSWGTRVMGSGQFLLCHSSSFSQLEYRADLSQTNTSRRDLSDYLVQHWPGEEILLQHPWSAADPTCACILVLMGDPPPYVAALWLDFEWYLGFGEIPVSWINQKEGKFHVVSSLYWHETISRRQSITYLSCLWCDPFEMFWSQMLGKTVDRERNWYLWSKIICQIQSLEAIKLEGYIGLPKKQN